ncbi:unnamed protein product, partial [Prorocentrum cordatum]
MLSVRSNACTGGPCARTQRAAAGARQFDVAPDRSASHASPNRGATNAGPDRGATTPAPTASPPTPAPTASPATPVPTPSPATPAPTAAPTTPTTTTAPRIPGKAHLLAGASAGDTAIDVDFPDGFDTGDEIEIAGDGNSERRVILDFGSVVLDRALEHSYPPNANVTRTMDPGGGRRPAEDEGGGRAGGAGRKAQA